MATRKTSRKRKPVQHSAWKPGWYRRMELRKRHVEQVVEFWTRLIVRAVGYGLVIAFALYALTAAYLGG